MRILVIGGMHGNEPLGVELVKIFKQKPVENIDYVFANPKAIKAGVRFIKEDLNRSFPGGKNLSYEQKRAQILINLCREYDVVFDFHNTNCPDNDCTFIGKYANKNLLAVSAFFDLKRVIIADYDCINKYAPNCISVEISLGSQKINTKYWYTKIIELSKLKTLPLHNKVTKYKFVYRMTLEDRDNLDLLSKNLKAFKAIDKELASSMGVQKTAYPIFINDAYTPYNFGGLLNKLQ